jgi:cysteine desulfurase/selenocysteine lyase
MKKFQIMLKTLLQGKTMNRFKKDFPIFEAAENKGIIYFDNAATAQRPYQVINAISDFYKKNNANPLRGLYDLSVRATDDYENARETVAAFINAKKASEIIFTRNTSESLNLIAYTWGMENVKEGDEIVVSVMEHHSNILPWQMLCKAKNAKLVFLEFDKKTGIIPEAELTKINSRTKIVAITQVSNVLGIRNDIKKIAELAHKNGAIMVVDGAQSTPHIRIDVQALDADFFAFSGHKLCAPMGIGVLYGKYELLENMPPFMRGGEMIEYVTRESATWAEIPHKFEAGTVNAADAVGLAAAINYLTKEVGYDFIDEQDKKLSKIMADALSTIKNVHVIGNPSSEKHSGIFAFTLDDVHPHDISTILDQDKIAIRAGHHCAHPLGDYLNIPSSARASLYFYNDEEEIAYFVEKLANVRKIMGFKN